MARRSRKKDRTGLIISLAIVAVLLVAAVATILINQKEPSPASSSEEAAQPGSASLAASEVPAAESGAAPVVTNAYQAIPLPEEMRAMWISFLEWKTADLSNEAAARTTFAQMFDNCAAMGLNTVIVAVRPFGDSYYPSDIFPWSDLLTGTQGQDPGYDPLAVMIEEAHARGLRLEAWINPYRIKSSSLGPAVLAQSNPAELNPDWVRDVGGNLWYDPGLPEVRELIARGVEEIVQRYEVDGIHFDDYFYPEFTPEQKEASLDKQFDAKTFSEYGQGYVLADWRRNNVDALVQDVYRRVKQANPTVSFGISPQGNNENNYAIQYSDVKKWMSSEGFIDYVMPQLYWGFGYETKAGRDTYAFPNISMEWAVYQRADSVKLYAGLGAYRIGTGDGGYNNQDEWSSGHNLKDMVEHLRTVPGYRGFALFRYEFLFVTGDQANQQERDALTALLHPAA